MAFVGKTIHQRNKSSPALSSQAQSQAAIKPVPKRTAFADLSNTARAVNAPEDDLGLGQKPALDILKEKVSQDAQGGAPLQKPAQRPLSVSSIKGFFNSFAASQQTQVTKKKPQQDTAEEINQKPQMRRVLSRKSTTVFREIENRPVALQQHQGANLAAALSEDVEAEKEIYPSDQSQLESIAQDVADKLPSQTTSSGAEFAKELEDVRSDGIPLEGSRYTHTTASIAQSLERPVDITHPVERSAQSQHRLLLEQIPEQAPPRRSSHSLTAAYPIAQENYEVEPYTEHEDDYTTARSLKSRGECTTNPTTIILAPKMTVSTERELEEASQYVQQCQEATELEEDEAWDTSMVSEYSEEIFSYMKNLEEQMRPNPHYMDNQTEVQWSMRSVLMDWLVQVHHRFSLLPETLFLCVNYIDRFLSCKVVSLGKLQLVGATAIFVAAKYEEINCPSVQEIVYMVDGGYTVDEILKAERFMLSMLHFELGWPGPMSFLRRISKADDYDLETRTLAKYFMEITIMDERFVGCIPSYTAAGAHCLSRLMLEKGDWVS